MHLIEFDVEKNIFEVNRKIAEENNKLLKKFGIKSYDFLGAIGSGKTALIFKISKILLEQGKRVAAITGDVAGDEDAKILRTLNIPVININTGKECHLNAHQIMHALEHLPLDGLDVLFVENVGNLVCPADFPLGTDKRIVIISVTEGDDMIVKHPYIFLVSDIAVLNKVDLVNVVGVSIERLKSDYKRLRPTKDLILTSAKTGEGIETLMREMNI